MTSLFTDDYRLAIDLLIGARQRAGITQQQLAERLGRPQSFVSKFERGERRLDVVEYVEIARCLGALPLELVTKIEAAVATRS